MDLGLDMDVGICLDRKETRTQSPTHRHGSPLLDQVSGEIAFALAAAGILAVAGSRQSHDFVVENRRDLKLDHRTFLFEIQRAPGAQRSHG